MTVTVLAASKEVRDAVLASGMEHGAAKTNERVVMEAQVARHDARSGTYCAHDAPPCTISGVNCALNG